MGIAINVHGLLSQGFAVQLFLNVCGGQLRASLLNASACPQV